MSGRIRAKQANPRFVTTKDMQKKNTWKDVNGPECNQQRKWGAKTHLPDKEGGKRYKIVALKLNKFLEARSLEAHGIQVQRVYPLTNSRIPLEYCPSLTCSKLKLINDSEGYQKTFVRPIMPLCYPSGMFMSSQTNLTGTSYCCQAVAQFDGPEEKTHTFCLDKFWLCASNTQPL